MVFDSHFIKSGGITIGKNIFDFFNITSTNSKILLKNVTGSFFIKGIAMFVSLFTIPVYMSYFSNQIVLGVWFTLISILYWILNFDLGIGNGLRNNLVHAFAEKNDDKARKYISSAYIILGLISIVIGLLGYIIVKFIDWNNILNISPEIVSPSILLITVRFLFMGIIIQFFLRIIVSILYAMQKTVLPSVLTLISTTLILLYMMVFKSVNIEQNMVNLAMINILAINIPLAITTIILFATKLRKSTPSLAYYVRKYAYNVMKLGGTFFLIQIMLVVITSTNQILITWFYGPEYVVEYQVYFKLFHLFVTLFSLITNPIWSAVSKAFAEKKYNWIIKVYRYLNVLSLVGLLACIGLTIFLQDIINIWLGQNTIQVNYYYGIIFALDSAIMIYIMAVTSIANGLGYLKPQLVCNSFVAILKIPLVYILSSYSTSWISIVLIGMVLMLPSAFIQSILINNKLKNLRRYNVPLETPVLSQK